MKARRVTLALLLAVGSMAKGQAKEPKRDSSCSDSSRVRSYAQCALWLGDKELIQGRPGVVVEHEGELRPAALSRYVAGGAARNAALRYERSARAGYTMRFTGGAMLLAGSVMVLSRHCGGACVPGNQSTFGGRMMFGGMGTLLVSFPFRWEAARAATRAIELHNAELTREAP